MPDEKPILYYDLGSPYAYLAIERAREVLGIEPRLEPVLVGGIFLERGHGSWAHTDERQARIAELEARAERYGLPTLVWPEGWPNNTLKAMRAAVWADRMGLEREFALAAFRAAFAEGRDLSQVAEVAAIADLVGLPAEMEAAIETPEIKEALRDSTASAWSRGVAGVPCIEVGGEIFYGDDRLEEAARSVASNS